VPQVAQADAGRGDRGLAAGGFQRPQNLADAIDADGQHQEADTAVEPRQVEEDQARLAGDQVEADGAEHQTEGDHQDRLGDVVAAEPDEGGEGQQDQRKLFGRPEGQRHVRQRLSEQGEQHHRDGAAHERPHGGGDQRQAGLPLLRHRPAVEGGGDRRRGSGDSEQDGADRAAVHGAVVQGPQEDDRRGGRHQESHRQQDGDAVDRPEARHCTHEQPDGDAENDHKKIKGTQRKREAVGQQRERFHGRLLEEESVQGEEKGFGDALRQQDPQAAIRGQPCRPITLR
jgi:hypothetical protein